MIVAEMPLPENWGGSVQSMRSVFPRLLDHSVLMTISDDEGAHSPTLAEAEVLMKPFDRKHLLGAVLRCQKNLA